TNEAEAAEVSSGATETRSEQEQPALISNVRVCAIAEKYNITSLKSLAQARFCIWAERNWTHQDFHDIVRDVFQSTPESDRGLRDIIVHSVAKHAQKSCLKTEFYNVIRENGELGLGTLRQVLASHSEDW
ncbi:uncharacterized protein A1O9_03031, partial [Exophiala aquamarina CBS 119918]